MVPVLSPIWAIRSIALPSSSSSRPLNFLHFFVLPSRRSTQQEKKKTENSTTTLPSPSIRSHLDRDRRATQHYKGLSCQVPQQHGDGAVRHVTRPRTRPKKAFQQIAPGGQAAAKRSPSQKKPTEPTNKAWAEDPLCELVPYSPKGARTAAAARVERHIYRPRHTHTTHTHSHRHHLYFCQPRHRSAQPIPISTNLRVRVANNQLSRRWRV